MSNTLHGNSSEVLRLQDIEGLLCNPVQHPAHVKFRHLQQCVTLAVLHNLATSYMYTCRLGMMHAAKQGLVQDKSEGGLLHSLAIKIPDGGSVHAV